MRTPDALRAIAWSYRSMTAAIITYAITVGFSLGGFVLYAYRHTMPAIILGVIAFFAACLCIARIRRAAHRWRAYAESLDKKETNR